MRKFLGCWILVGLVVAGSATVGASAPAASQVYAAFSAELPAGAAYAIDAHRLHPTQFTLGWREVVYKAGLFDAKSVAQGTAYLQTKDVPIVIGPGGVPYLSDGHHTLRGLLLSGRADKTAYGHVLANWSNLAPAEFWSRMVAANYAYLRDAAGHEQPPETLPTTLEAMTRDPYRGLTWALKEAGVFEERRDVYFQEFFWGDYLRGKVVWNDADDVDFARAVAEATRLAHAPAAQSLPGAKP